VRGYARSFALVATLTSSRCRADFVPGGLAGRVRPARGTTIRPSHLLTIAALAFLTARGAAAIGVFTDSPYLEVIPASGPCDAIVDESVAPAALETLLNDPSKRVFCVEPGDYRAAGELLLTTSGTAQNRRFLRFDPHDGKRNAAERTERALFESIRVRSSWWVIQGLTIQPRDGATAWFLIIYGGDHNILDGNLIDGVEHVPQMTTQNAVVVAGYNGDPATFNSVQANVVRNGNQGGRPGDYEGIQVIWGNTAGEDNDFNKVLDNEVYDWGSGISVDGHTEDCSEPGVPHGSVIDGNDVYITAAKRIDCGTGAPNPSGECACAEEGISVKSRAGAAADQWTRITGNRTWGFRPTSATANCGGSGANGQAITAGNLCPAHVLVAGNKILDSTQGITAAGSSWIIAGNLIHDIRMAGPLGIASTLAIFPSAYATDVQIEFNTVVDVDRAYDDVSVNTDTRCNAVINDHHTDNMGTGGIRGTNHSTEYNFLYSAPGGNFLGSTNELYPDAPESGNTAFCFWRKRWTAPERVCIPYANSTASSPHEEVVASCDPDLLAPFGMDPVSYPSTLVPEPVTAWVECASAVALGALSRRRRRALQRRS
jgi:hypothetical protein